MFGAGPRNGAIFRAAVVDKDDAVDNGVGLPVTHISASAQILLPSRMKRLEFEPHAAEKCRGFGFRYCDDTGVVHEPSREIEVNKQRDTEVIKERIRT